jgi:hypothetical protein
MPRVKDLTFKLPTIKTQVELWSSDPVNFNIENKLISITLENTVSDILEVITLRSVESGGNLNPRCLKVYFRHQEVLPFQPLSDFLQQEEHVNRLRVEVNRDQLGSSSVTHIRPALLNINLKLASGKTVSVREPLDSSIGSLKTYVAEAVGIDETHIDHFAFNGGVTIHNEDVTLGELLGLDTAPLGDLNIYVALESDFETKLSSPVENLLRTNKVYSMLDTSILTIKYFIIDQYIGPNDIKPEDIRIIYFGRVLTDATKLKEIIHSHTVISSLTLHFVLKEPEEQLPSQGFWRDLRRGALFEFLPREPNPNFEVEVQRDERLREQLRNGTAAGTATEIPAEPVRVRDDTESMRSTGHSSEEDDTYAYHHNAAPHLSSGELTGESRDEIRMHDGTLVLRDQTDTSSTVLRVILNTTSGDVEVTLSSSQAIINDTDASNPYLMLSPSGYAKLQQLGVDVERPEVVIEQESQNNEDARPPTASRVLLPFQGRVHTFNIMPDGANGETLLAQNGQQQQQQPAYGRDPRQRERTAIRGYFSRLNTSWMITNFVMPLYNVMKYQIVYYVLIDSPDTNHLVRWLVRIGLFVHFLSSSSNSHVLRFLSSRLMNEGMSNQLGARYLQFTEIVHGLTISLLSSIIELGLPLEKRQVLVQVPIDVVVTIVSFMITLVPQLTETFLELIEKRKAEIREGHVLQDAELVPEPVIEGEGEWEDIRRSEGASGTRVHHENTLDE